MILRMKLLQTLLRLQRSCLHGFSTFDMDQLGKICRHHWKEPHKINKGAKSESDTSLVRRYRSAKLRKVTDFCLQTLCPPKFVPPPHPPYKRLKNFMTLRSYIFVNFQQIPFKLGNFTNLKALFPAECRIFPNLSMPKVEIKKTWKGVLYQEL